MLEKTALWIALASLIGGCSAETAGAPATDDDLTELTKLSIDADLRWTCGDGMEEDEPLTPPVAVDEEDGFVARQDFTFGPIKECKKTPAKRASGSIRSWTVPSSCWNLGLEVVAEGKTAILRLSVTAGDLDTSGLSSLPVASVPTSAPWRIKHSPDEAGGSWGTVSASILRIASE